MHTSSTKPAHTQTMSSPLRRTNSRSSPSRLTPNGMRRSQTNNYHSPLRPSPDTPTRLAEEFSNVYIDKEKSYRKKLDEHDDEQARLHIQALAKSLEEHERIRLRAERTRERLLLELERIEVQKAEDARLALEEERRRTAEAEADARQRELDAVKRREEALQQAAHKQREVEEAQRRIDAQRKQEEEDKAKREAERAKEEADRKTREESIAKEQAEAAKKAAQPAPPTAQPQPQPAATQAQTNGTPAPTQTSNTTVSPTSTRGVLVPKGIVTPAQEREAEHKRYMDLHQQLKVMRNDTLEQAKKIGLKNQLGDMRRDVKKVMGQMNKVDKNANREAVSFEELTCRS